MGLIKTAAEIFRRYVTDGVPASGPNPVNKDDVRVWGTFLESTLGQAGLGYATLALLNGDLAHGAGSLALVYNDPTPANNGLYQKSGSSGSGAWTRVGDLPSSVVNLTVTGGTGDAIVASAIETPSAPGAKLYLLAPTAPNTGATTISVNGGSSVAIKNAFNVALAAGSLLAGSQVLMAWNVDHYQLMISANVDASAILAAAQAAATAAAGSASAAASSAASLSGVVGMSPPGGRLTLTAGTPFPSADVAAATAIRYTPALSEWLRIYDGSNDILTAFTELSLSLDSNSGHAGYHQAGKIFDAFVCNSSGIKFGTGPAWLSDMARGTGAGTTEIEFYRGLWRNKNSITLRIGTAAGDTITVPARQATVVGSFRATADGQASDTVLRRLVSNAYNPAPRFMYANGEPLGTTWLYTLLTWRQVNGNTANKVEFLQCLPGGPVEATAFSTAAHSVGNATKYVGIGVNSVTVNSGKGGLLPTCGANLVSQGYSDYSGFATLGYTYLAWLEISAATGVTTWYSGDSAAAAVFSNGIRGKVWN
ncbi:oxidoreductase [Bradyrhizobium ottawaense]|uniref:oxidoreductase n=1 Tax=Bradyrhizobium ottawaense TaxID=931866 RepID=UPI0027148249|nr:oxidoreductase [Bradyrhizobium ottawaense]WLB43009.1 oxidoreductase [Bradyrhizobium ottawaense]